MLAFPYPSRQAGNRQVAISLARVVLFRVKEVSAKKDELADVLISLARVVLFREYPSGSRINKGLQRAVLNNYTKKHLSEFIFLFTKP